MRSDNNSIRAVIFDMGNVVLNVDHMIACKKFSEFSYLSQEEIYKKIIGTRLEDSFERGIISPKTFYKSVTERIGVDIPFNDFSLIFNDVFSNNDEMHNTIISLKDEVKILLLSNTNKLHFSWVIERFDILKNFNIKVLSYEIGSRKPEKKIFLHALDILGYQPEETIYIDDIPGYVEASKKLGMNAILFRSFSTFKSALLKYFS
jgi:glucose-1-phosphatase